MPMGLTLPRMFIALASGGIVLWLLSWLKPVLVPVVLAAFLAFLLSPVVAFLQRKYFPRVLAVIATVIIAFTLIAGVTWSVARQVSGLVDTFPQYEKNLSKKLDTLRQGEPGFIDKTQRIVKRVSRQIQKIRPPADRQATENALPVKVVDGQSLFPVVRLWSVAAPVVEPFAMFGLAVVLVIFMLLRREDLRDRLIDLVGQRQLTLTTKAIDEAAERISHYLLRQLAINASFGLAIAIGLYVLDVPYALLWGFFAGVLRYIPYLGPWLAAILPLSMSLIVSESWAQPLLVLALFLSLELFTNMIMEPWIYGRSIGVSEMAVVLMIVFWTWLWGPVGLVVGTPLTVCLLVLGKYVPSLGFLETLLGNQRVLEADMRYYQRLLARDHDEASDIATACLSETSLLQAYERLLVPALTHAKRDLERGTVTEDDYRFIVMATREVAEELAALHADRTDAAEASHRLDVVRLLLIPARDEADEIAAEMLKRLLDPGRYRVFTAPAGILVSEAIDKVKDTQAALVCIVTLPPGGGAHARLLCMRLRMLYPDIRLLVGRWNIPDDAGRSQAQFLRAGATQFAATLNETCAHIASWRSMAPAAAGSGGKSMERFRPEQRGGMR